MATRKVRMSRRLFAVLIVAVMIVTGLQYWRARQIREALYAAFTPVQLTNCTLQRFGETNDGGYLMCGNLLSAAQSGYSYGIGGADAWGCDVATLFDIPIHQYDCFNTTETRCPGNSSRFHAECIGPERVTTDGRPFDTFANHIERNGDAGKRLVVKMDVEGAEWRSLLIAPDHALEAIDQMVIEFHNVEEASFLETAVRLRQFFHVANVHMNNWSCRPGVEPFPADVFEALLVNKRIAVADTSITAPARSGLDAPNMPEYPDCQQSAPVSELQRIARWTYRKVRTAVSLVRRTVVG